MGFGVWEFMGLGFRDSRGVCRVSEGLHHDFELCAPENNKHDAFGLDFPGGASDWRTAGCGS